ncbi:MAG: Gfo/Idh/MocA family oxidoreductase [Fimbriimonadales bacterium]
MAVRIAIIGCGGFAGVHARRLQAIPEAEVVALQDVSQEQLDRFYARWYGDAAAPPSCFVDRGEMYASAKPDAVVICTPHTLHFEHGMEAFSQGCHVLMEKPMVTNVRDAVRLENAAAGKVLIVGYNTPCTSAFRELKNVLTSGMLGELQMVTGWLSQDWKNLTQGMWRQEPSLSGGGQMYDSGAHLFNSLVWSVDLPVKEVFAVVDNRDTAVDINGVAVIKFENGPIANIMISGDCAQDGAGMTFIFSDGLLEVDGWGGSFLKYKSRGEGDWIVPELDESSNPDQNFVRSILGEEMPLATGRHGILQSQLMDAIYESARTGRPVSPDRDFETV